MNLTKNNNNNHSNKTINKLNIKQIIVKALRFKNSNLIKLQLLQLNQLKKIKT